MVNPLSQKEDRVLTMFKQKTGATGNFPPGNSLGPAQLTPPPSQFRFLVGDSTGFPILPYIALYSPFRGLGTHHLWVPFQGGFPSLTPRKFPDFMGRPQW